MTAAQLDYALADVEHLHELRTRLLLSLLAIVVVPLGAAPWWLVALVHVVFLAPPGWFARITR